MSNTEINNVKIHSEELKNLLVELSESDDEQFETGDLETRFEDENGRDTGYTIAIQDIAKNALDRIIELEKKIEQNEWIPIDSAEDLPEIYQEYLLWDGYQLHIDYVAICSDTGTYYFAKGTEATHYKILKDGPRDEK